MVDSIKGLPTMPYGMGNNLQGVSTLLQRPQTSGIDFMAFARGQQMARDVSWQQRLREQQEQMMQLQQLNWQDQLRQRQANLASSAAQRELNRLRDASGNQTDFYADLNNNPEYLAILESLPDEARGIFEDNVRASRLKYATDLQKLGDREGFNRVLSGYGLPTGDQRQADLLDFNLPAAITAINERAGMPVITLNEDGTVSYQGQTFTAGEMAAVVASGDLSTAGVLSGLNRLGAAKLNAAGRDSQQMIQDMNPGFAGPGTLRLGGDDSPVQPQTSMTADSEDPVQQLRDLQQSPNLPLNTVPMDEGMLISAVQDPQQLANLSPSELIQARQLLIQLRFTNISPEERAGIEEALKRVEEAQRAVGRANLSRSWEGFKNLFRTPSPTEDQAEWIKQLQRAQSGGQ